MSNSWDTFWLACKAPHALALTRIALGFYLLLYALLHAPHITLLFSNEGIVLPLYADMFPQFGMLLQPPDPWIAYCLYFLGILGILGIIMGAWYRISVLTVILIGLYAWQLQLHLFPTSYNRILLFTLIVLLFSGAHRTFSIDQWRRSGSPWDWEEISILPQRLIALQISCTFLGVSLQKWWLPLWQGGEVLGYAFIGRWGTPVAQWFSSLPLDTGHYDFLVLMVKIGQPLAAVGLWFKRYRLASFLFISSFIVLVAAMLSIWWFVYIIPACILFWSPEEVAGWFFDEKELEKLRRGGGK